MTIRELQDLMEDEDLQMLLDKPGVPATQPAEAPTAAPDSAAEAITDTPDTD